MESLNINNVSLVKKIIALNCITHGIFDRYVTNKYNEPFLATFFKKMRFHPMFKVKLIKSVKYQIGMIMKFGSKEDLTYGIELKFLYELKDDIKFKANGSELIYKELKLNLDIYTNIIKSKELRGWARIYLGDENSIYRTLTDNMDFIVKTGYNLKECIGTKRIQTAIKDIEFFPIHFIERAKRKFVDYENEQRERFFDNDNDVSVVMDKEQKDKLQSHFDSIIKIWASRFRGGQN